MIAVRGHLSQQLVNLTQQMEMEMMQQNWTSGKIAEDRSESMHKEIYVR